MNDLDSSEPRRDGSRVRRCFRKQGVVGEAAAGDGDRKFLAPDQPQGKVSFLDWLATAPVTDDPAGDLIDDLRRDPRKPADIMSASYRRNLVMVRVRRQRVELAV
jgi:hypothetical protein